jgi:hypothetical protein
MEKSGDLAVCTRSRHVEAQLVEDPDDRLGVADI